MILILHHLLDLDFVNFFFFGFYLFHFDFYFDVSNLPLLFWITLLVILAPLSESETHHKFESLFSLCYFPLFVPPPPLVLMGSYYFGEKCKVHKGTKHN